jgi:hypothetical protein
VPPCELKVANETDDAVTTGESGSTSPTTGEPWTLDGCMTHFHWECPVMQTACGPPQPLPLPQCGGPMLCDPLQISVSGGGSAYNYIYSESDVPCVLQALRDRTPGQLQIGWGITMEDGPGVFAQVWLPATAPY